MDDTGKDQQSVLTKTFVSDALSGQLRLLIAAGGGVVATFGWLSEKQVASLVGFLIIAVPMVLSWWIRVKEARKTVTREAVVFNSGAAVADGTVGPTPIVSASEVPKLVALVAPQLPPIPPNPEPQSPPKDGATP